MMLAASNNWDTEQRIKVLTEEQYEILDAICDNPICIIRGPAGTGKTLLAIEQAKRYASRGMDVVVSCFNRHLAGWLKSSIQTFGPGKVVAGNIHSLLRERICRSSFSADLRVAEERGGDALYARTFFDLGALAIEELAERFQAVIIDEVQDMPPAGLAEVVYAWTNVQPDPRVLLAGDFTRQALYAGGTCSADEVRKAFGEAPLCNLSINCRNTRRIAIQTDFMSGFVGTRISPKQIEGDPVEVRFFNGPKTCVEVLERIVESLRSVGFRPADIVVLGTRRMENSPVAGLRTVGGWPLSNLISVRQVGIMYSTIYAFKGLESPVAIILGATATSTEETDSLLYVAMSRARIRLYLLWPEESRTSVEERLARGAAAMAGAV
jgi:DNA helicase IV